MLKIIGRKSSSNVQKVLWACGEMGITYERQDAGREFGVVDTPEYAKLNPNRRVPTMVEDDFVLWESNSIVRYLAAKQGSSLYPTDLRARADAERWMDWQLAALGPAFTGIFHGLVRTEPDKRNWDSINKSRDATEHHLQMLDDCLSKKEFVAGDALTIGDIPVGIYAYRWYAFEGIERKDLPNLKRWYDTLCQRPAYQEFVMVGM